MPTSRSWTRMKAFWSTPPSPNPNKAIRPSRGWSSRVRLRPPSCAASRSMMAGKSLDERSVDTYGGRAEAGRTCERRKSRHGSWRSVRKRPVESDRLLTYADAGRLVESVGAPSPPSNRSNRGSRSARIACLPASDSTNMTNGMYVVQKTITKAIFFTGHETYPQQTYDRWANLLVRSCWEFLFRWRNLGIASIPNLQLCFTLLGLAPRMRCLRLATADVVVWSSDRDKGKRRG